MLWHVICGSAWATEFDSGPKTLTRNLKGGIWPMSLFTEFTKQYIGGEWVYGSSENKCINHNPYDQSELVSIQLATKEDIDT